MFEEHQPLVVMLNIVNNINLLFVTIVLPILKACRIAIMGQ